MICILYYTIYTFIYLDTSVTFDFHRNFLIYTYIVSMSQARSASQPLFKYYYPIIQQISVLLWYDWSLFILYNLSVAWAVGPD